ncbi:MAG: alginate export family protein [candidate division Zixibacteria bacterium]|nr:alginate export family protein [candidate division Zixibacteria bacterium]
MKGLANGLVVLILALTITIPVNAETEYNLSGQIRLREVLDNRSFDTSNEILNFSELRTRVSAEAIVDDNAHAFVQLQDSRLMGGFDQHGNRTSGELNDGKNLDLHQAYFQLDNLFVEGIGMKAGRFELVFGNQRVFSAGGWSNVGRSWEGAIGWYDHPRVKITGFGMKAIERNSTEDNADFDIAGSYLTLKEYDVDLFTLFEYDADKTDLYHEIIKRLNRMSFGTYFTYQYQKLDFEFNSVYQTGTQARGPYEEDTLKNKDKLDIAAFMFSAEAGYSFEAPCKMRFAAGIDYTSGDDDDSDDKLEAYNNLFFAGHKFNGHMDLFINRSGQDYEYAGLSDIILRASVEPAEGWNIKADAHFFSTTENYDYIKTSNDEGSIPELYTSSDVGVEIDASVATTKVAGVHILVGGSAFFAKEAFAGHPDPDPAFWGFTTMTVNF